MADHSQLIEQFTNMTGVEATQAQFYLEIAGWDLNSAVSDFYDNSGSSEPQRTATTSSSSAPEPFTAPTKSAAPSTFQPGPSKKKAQPSRNNTSKIRTLNDIGAGNHDEDSEDEERESFFAGGEKSGMVVQGPNKKSGGSSLIDDILKKAAAGGAGPEEDNEAESSRPAPFSGSGYTLGSDDTPSQQIGTANPASTEVPQGPITRYLTFWRNGFSVDDGPLFRYDDPANEAMLSAINSGRAPLSLLNVQHGQAVDVRVAKRQDEDFVPPPKSPPKPFESAGHRLGSPASYIPSTPGAFPTSSSVEAPRVDASQPTTSIQIRLADGTRLVAKLNHTHTVGDIRQYIEASHPDQRPYVLQTTFPVKVLENSNQTIKDAGLLNSVVVQRYQ
ncbi:hypothetical protein F4703DRAFT_1820128 [Phycomyces blakesleeanus]